MRLSSPISARRTDVSSSRPRTGRLSPVTGSGLRGPTLCLHVSAGYVAWAVVARGAAPELLAAGTLAVDLAVEPDALAQLVSEHHLPRSGARLAVPGSVRVAGPDEEPGVQGTADVELADGRSLRVEVDADMLAVALEACAHAGIEIVCVEPEPLPLARALAIPLPDAEIGAILAVVWVASTRALVIRSYADVVELVGTAEIDALAAPSAIAAAVGPLLGAAGAAEAVIASAAGHAATLAGELATVSGLRVRAGDPLARIRASADAALDAAVAAGAVGLALDVRGFPRVEIPVRPSRTQRTPSRAEADPEPPPPPPPPPPSGHVPPADDELPARRTRQAASRMLVLCVAAAVVVGSLVVGWTYSERAAVRDRTAVLTTLRTQLAGIPSPTEPTLRLLTLGADRRARVDAIASALGGRVAWDRILREVSAVLPPDIWLTELTASATKPSTVQLRGYAANQEGVALALSRLAIISDLSNVRLRRSERATVQGTQVVRFSIVTGVRTDGP